MAAAGGDGAYSYLKALSDTWQFRSIFRTAGKKKKIKNIKQWGDGGN